jgi:pyrimidine dimer DNA glycosylase
MLDRAGLVALWREGLLAQKVLQGNTKGYRFHPQLVRFKASEQSVAAIASYLWAVVDEATVRGYCFDATKIAVGRIAISLIVTQGQLEYEFEHLKHKLRARDPERLKALGTIGPRPHPLFVVQSGPIASWEIVPR